MPKELDVPDLESEVKRVRKEVVTDGYEMSIGELAGLYKEGELIINPAFQRYYRWDILRKTRFVESILLGIPIPPIFVFQRPDANWELVDGLQRLSTLLQLLGVLKSATGAPVEPLRLTGTRLLPSLEGCSWEGADDSHALPAALRIDIKRARVRVEILKRESDQGAKFELFQRLNTGGSPLSEQEVRNCTMVMINPRFHTWLTGLAAHKSFLASIGVTANSTERQYPLELALRLLASRRYPYKNGLDVHEYLDDACIKMALDSKYPQKTEGTAFKDTFDYVHGALGDASFRRWDGTRFTGKFLVSVFEVVAIGVSHNIESLRALTAAKRSSHILSRAKDLWSDRIFKSNSGAGVRGTTRIARLLPLAETMLAP